MAQLGERQQVQLVDAFGNPLGTQADPVFVYQRNLSAPGDTVATVAALTTLTNFDGHSYPAQTGSTTIPAAAIPSVAPYRELLFYVLLSNASGTNTAAFRFTVYASDGHGNTFPLAIVTPIAYPFPTNGGASDTLALLIGLGAGMQTVATTAAAIGVSAHQNYQTQLAGTPFGDAIALNWNVATGSQVDLTLTIKGK